MTKIEAKVEKVARGVPEFALRAATGFLCFALSIAAPAGLHAEAPKKVRFVLDWALQGPQAVFLMPESQACYKTSGIDVVTDRGYGSGDTISKVGAGTYDVGFADVNAMIEYNARNPSSQLISVFIVYDGSPLSIVTLKGNGIATPKDLPGHTLAAPPGDASRRLLPLLAKSNGVDYSKISWINVSPEIRESVLARHGADGITGAAFTSYIGVRAAGVPAADIVVLRYPDFGVDLFGSGIVVRQDFAQSNGTALKSFLSCMIKGIQAAVANPDAAITALVQANPVAEASVERERLQLSIDWSILTPLVKEKGLSFVDPARLARTSAQVAETFAVAVPSASDVYTDKYLPNRSDMMLSLP